MGKSHNVAAGGRNVEYLEIGMMGIADMSTLTDIRGDIYSGGKYSVMNR